MKIITLHIALFLVSCNLLGQTLKAEISKNEIAIGEPVLLTLSIESKTPLDSLFYKPQQSIFLGKNAIDSIGQGEFYTDYELEILQGFTDTNYQKNDLFVWEGYYTLTGWDSAFVILPEDSILFTDSTKYFNTCALQVISPVAKSTQPIYDIVALETELPNQRFSFLKKHGWWIGLVLLVGCIGLFLYLKKKKDSPKIKVISKSLREITIEKIDTLEQSKLYQHNLKEYYYELSIIIRHFLTEHYREKYLDKTTSEIKLVLAKNKINKDTIETISVLLRQADMVKFAKSKPTEADILSITNKARQIIEEVAAIELIVSK